MKSVFQDLKELKTGPRELRKFGWLVGGVFCAIGLWMLLKGKPAHPWLWGPGAVLVVLGTLLPRSLKQVYLVWMGMATVLGFIVSHVILTLFFFLVITPIGLAARMAGKDFLRLKLDSTAASYWIPRERGKMKRPSEYEKQF